MPPTDIPDTWDDCNVCRGGLSSAVQYCEACMLRTIAALRARVAVQRNDFDGAARIWAERSAELVRERDAALARVAEVERERDEARRLLQGANDFRDAFLGGWAERAQKHRDQTASARAWAKRWKAHARREREGCRDLACAAQRWAEAQARLARVEAALRARGHLDSCDTMRAVGVACDCGLAAALGGEGE